MKFTPDLTNAQSDLQLLTQMQKRLAVELIQAATLLRSHGTLPPEDLLDDLNAFRLQVERLTSSLNLTGHVQLATNRSGNQTEHLPSLEEIRGAIHQSRQLRGALGLLELVNVLTHDEEQRFAPLVQLQQTAEILRKDLQAGAIPPHDSEVEQLFSGEHPYWALLILSSFGETLSDDVWSNLENRVGTKFGRLLAAAVARGRIRLPASKLGEFENLHQLLLHKPDSFSSRMETLAIADRQAVQRDHHDPGSVKTSRESMPENPSISGEMRRSTGGLNVPERYEMEVLAQLSSLPPEPVIQESPRFAETIPLDQASTSSEKSKSTTPAIEVRLPIEQSQPTVHEPEPLPFTANESASSPLNDDSVYGRPEIDATSVFETAPSDSPANPTKDDVPTDVVNVNKAPESKGIPHKSRSRIQEQSVLDEAQESIFDSIGEDKGLSGLRRVSRALDKKLLAEDPYRWIYSTSGKSQRSVITSRTRDPLPDLARETALMDEHLRSSHISQIVLQLMWDDRIPMAFHLAKSAEKRNADRLESVPTWLIHALALNRHVCYSKGEISRQVELDLQNFRADMLTLPNGEWAEAQGLFLRAAAITPALLISSPAATAILRAFRITPGLSHLYNYCSRLAMYGQRLNGQASDLFTPDCDLSKWEEEMRSLREEVSQWLEDRFQSHSPMTKASPLFLHAHWSLMTSRSTRFADAARLWSKWQETFRICERLLRPVRMGHEPDRTWVKNEITRLTESIRLEGNSPESQYPSVVGGLFFPLQEMVMMIRDAIDHASRWLRLCASKPTQGRTLVARDAEILRDEILDRTDGVIQELAMYVTNHSATCVRAAVACLCREIEHLRSIFSPHSTLALRESDPREILNSEFLKFPNMHLNEHWNHELDGLTLEQEILSYLSGPQKDWKQAFDLKCAQQDHLATGRILEMKIWKSEREQETFKQRRMDLILRCREETSSLLSELESAIQSQVASHQLGEQAQEVLEKRIQKLRSAISRTVDFLRLKEEINQLRLTIDRRKRNVQEQSNSRQTSQEKQTPPKPAITSEADWLAELPPTKDSWALDIFSEN